MNLSDLARERLTKKERDKEICTHMGKGKRGERNVETETQREI